MEKYIKPELEIKVFTQSETIADVSLSGLGSTEEEVVDPFA